MNRVLFSLNNEEFKYLRENKKEVEAVKVFSELSEKLSKAEPKLNDKEDGYFIVDENGIVFQFHINARKNNDTGNIIYFTQIENMNLCDA